MCCAAKAISSHFLPFQWNHRVFLFVVLDGDTRPRYNHLHKVNESKKKEENAFTGSIATQPNCLMMSPQSRFYASSSMNIDASRENLALIFVGPIWFSWPLPHVLLSITQERRLPSNGKDKLALGRSTLGKTVRFIASQFNSPFISV